MPDFKKMTVERLRELARKVLGPGHSKLRKSELVRALEEAGGKAAEKAAAPARAAGKAARAASSRAAAAGEKAVEVARKAGKAAREGARAVARAGKAAAGAAQAGVAGAARQQKGGKGERAAKPAAPAPEASAEGAAPARRKPVERPATGPDPEGYFVARVRGEDAVREAPHPMSETGGAAEYSAYPEGVGAPTFEEHLGEVPWGYGDDAFVALPRDPRTLFLYWDLARETVARGFEGLEHGRVQLWVFARAGEGWDRIRATEFALESRGWYVHDLEPGRTYRAEIHAVDARGRERPIASVSNEVTLPPIGPSPVLDDRFARIPWDQPLGRSLGPGHPGAPFSDEARAALARASDWTRFAGATWGGSAGGEGGRPSSPSSAPSSPGRPWGEGGER